MKIIRIYDDKYQILMNDNGTINEIRRHNLPWPAGNANRYSGMLLALVQELEEAKDAILAFYKDEHMGVNSVPALDKLGEKIEKERNDPS